MRGIIRAGGWWLAVGGLTSSAGLANGFELSSSTVSDPHHLISTAAFDTAELAPLTVFPERLVYQVSWGIVSVGEATLKIERIIDFRGVPAYEIVSEARSNSFCDTFYKVRDLNESWVDARALTSLGYSKKLREGHFFRDEWVLFEPRERRFLAKTTNRDGLFSFSAGTTPVSVQDVLSSLYYVRSQELAVGKEIILDVNTKQNWPLVVKVTGHEKVSTPAGKFQAFVVEPMIRQEGIFIQKGKRLRVWMTDDKAKIPVQVKVEVFFGHVTAKLSKML